MKTLLCCGLLFAAIPCLGQRGLIVKGHVHYPESIDGPGRITLMTACGDTLASGYSRNDRFRYQLHRDASYILRFSHPGLVTTDVAIAARELPRVRKVNKVRLMRFNILMEEGDPDVQMRHGRAVGFTGFSSSAGKVRVVYDYTIEPIVSEAQVEQ